MRDNPYRLPRTASPSRYDLVLEPDLVAATFSGTVDVALDVHAATDELVCNAAELEIDRAWVTTADGRRVDVVAKLDEPTERLHLGVRTTLSPGPVTLHIDFRGMLNDKLRGFYRSTFTDDAGVEHVVATTQMESTDCRRAFPCWDEPDFKAVFGVTLVVADGLYAVSNGPEIDRQAADGGRVRIVFADTMKMSTYLAAFVVGPLEATEPVDVDGVPLRVVHVPGKGHLAGYALEVGAFALHWFQEYYGIRYPERKVDLVALPDFAFGAMENPGCVTFRETALLVDPATATQQDRQRIADIIAHELAHMWFGDLVTMKWWNGIWLNEAFATFMATLASDAFRPDWKRWTTFSLERTAAFEVDALLSTRPIEYEVVSPADADGMFDVLTYEKGGSLLRMLEQYLGPDRFREGIRRYLATHAYANTETSDLWDAIEAATGEPVRRMMDSWIWQGGFPLVHAALGDEPGALRLSQRRFLFSGDDDGSRWVVPMHIRQADGGQSHDQKLLLGGEEHTVDLSRPDAVVVANVDANGFFRVEYDAALLARLAGPALAALTTAERYSLVDDAWASVVAGRLRAEDYCRFVRGFSDEPDLPVWEIVLAGLGWIDRLVDGEAREGFRAYVRALVAPALERLGWAPRSGEDELTGELRGTLIRALGVLGDDPAAVERARALHARSVDDPSSVHPAVAAAALSVVAATGDEADYDSTLNRYRTARTPQDQRRELFALAEFQPEPLVRRTLALAFSDEVKSQDAPFLLGKCVAHRQLGALAWRFVRERWDEANRRFPVNLVVRIIEPITRLTTPEQQADVAAFLAEHPIPQAGKRVEQLLERQAVNVALRQREAPALAQAFG
jgi:puromycin-sensitive aminopeptidase